MLILNDRTVINARHPGEWSLVDAPAVNIAASITLPASPNVRHMILVLLLIFWWFW